MHIPNVKVFLIELFSIYYLMSFTFCLIKFLKPERIVKHPEYIHNVS